MRVRKKAWAEDELTSNIYMVKDVFENKGKWKDYFNNDNPIYVEIGCGKGRFTIQNAVNNPNINYIAIERQPSVIAVAARAVPKGTKNLALICGNVMNLLDYFESGEIKRLYINFCDPWPKKRWAKRRLTHRGFLEKYKTLFNGSGEIFFKTDNKGLFEFSLNEFCGNNWRLSNISLDLHKSDFEGNIMTEYEEKFSSKGMPIYRCEAAWTER